MWNGLASFTFPFWFGGAGEDSSWPHRRRAKSAEGDKVVPREGTADANDVRLVTRVREGTEEDAWATFDDLYMRTFDRLFRFAAQMLNDTELARDVVQDTFVALWVSRHTWHAPGGSEAYLYAAVRNRSIMHMRRAGVRDRADPTRVPTPSDLVAPDMSVESLEFHRAFHTALNALSERRRTAFLLYAADGLTYEAIGQVLGVSKQAAFKQVVAAITQLRTLLARFAG